MKAKIFYFNQVVEYKNDAPTVNFEIFARNIFRRCRRMIKNLIGEIKEISAKVNRSAKILLRKQNLNPNLDLELQCRNQIEYFKLLNELKKVCKQRNLKLMMITLVVHHTKSDSLEKSYRILKTASKKLFYLIEWKKFSELIGVQDFIKKLEIDFNDNAGWHPHYHILLICENSIAIEFVSKYQKKFSKKYFEMCVSAGMTKTSRVKNFMIESGLNLVIDLQHPAYISDCRKLLKPRIEKLKDKNFSPYMMSTYKGYESEFKEFAKFIKNKKIFEFSRPMIENIDFDYKEINKTKNLKTATVPDLSEVQTTGYYKVQPKRYWHMIFQFLPDKMLKHYNIGNYNDDYRKFKIWLCFISGVNWWNFYNYVKQNFDNDIFSTKRKSNDVPELVKKLVKSYEEFLSNVATLDYRDPFLYKSQGQLIEDFSDREEFLDLASLRFEFENGKLKIVGKH